MNWDIVEGNWKQFKGMVKAEWGNLPDDYLDMIAGKRVVLMDKHPGCLWNYKKRSRAADQAL